MDPGSNLGYPEDFVTQAPLIESDGHLRSLLNKEFGIVYCTIRQLSGYDDLNFLLSECELGESANALLKNSAGMSKRHKFVLKFSNPVEARSSGLIEAQIKLMEALKKNGVPCAEVLPYVDGKFFKLVRVSGQVHLPMRLFTFVHGKMYDEFEHKHTNEAYSMIGRLLAKFHRVCDEKLEHDPQCQPFKLHCPFFSLENLSGIERELEMLCESHSDLLSQTNDVIDPSEKIRVAQTAIFTFKKEILARKEIFLKGIIHSDFNEANLLFDTENGKSHISALLDFGDTHYSLRIYDVANAILYIYLDFDLESKAQYSLHLSQLERISFHLISSYLEELVPMSAERTKFLGELKYIGICMRARLVLSSVCALRAFRINYRYIYIKLIWLR
ncbi:phosphotransferase enzyme family domain-containing protein [Ditylenchus destructor]|uniref:Hydroxylysine kinase n=1 Tax=Ditylenchus destructor TaxID=166010 RepID=A0AAD4QXQ6_9BILA|nr:phosphotransferase enzyme family domain-containing protein [Ditylenchus destructor]